MSWQAYVDTNLVGSGYIDKAIIIGHDGTAWASSKDFALKGDEAKKLIAGFTDGNSLRANGLYIAGEKYLTIKADERSIYGKKGSAGVVNVKTGLAILIGHYKDGVQPGQATNAVEKLADYLIENSF